MEVEEKQHDGGEIEGGVQLTTLIDLDTTLDISKLNNNDSNAIETTQIFTSPRNEYIEQSADLQTIPEKMRALPFVSKDAKITIKIAPTPTPTDDEILIKVSCFGLNFADTIARKGEYPDAPPFPFIPGYEVSGIIVAVGKNVNNFKQGARVAALTRFGGYAEYAVAHAVGAFELPPDMSFEDGASIPVVFLTAYYCLHCTGPVRAGDRLLIHAAAGGVGLATVQFAKLAKLTIFGTASTPKLKLLKDDWGVDHVIDYRNKDFVTEIQKINGSKKPCLDIVIDSVAGAQIKRDFELVRACGRVIGLGVSSMQDRRLTNTLNLIGNAVSMLTINSISMLLNSTTLCGVNLKRISDERPEIVAECIQYISNLFLEGKLKTFVTKVYPWEDINQAHKDIESRGTVGKLILRVTPSTTEK